MMPALSLSGFMLFLMVINLQRINYLITFNTRKQFIFVVIILILFGGWRVFDIKNIFNQKNQIKEESLIVFSKLTNEFKNHIKIFYGLPNLGAASSPVFALAYGNTFIANFIYSELLQKIYGDVYFYNILDGKFYTWNKVLSFDDVISLGFKRGIVFDGPSLSRYDNKIICLDNAISRIRMLTVEYFIFRNPDDETVLQCSPLNGFIDKTKCGSYKILHLKDVLGYEYETIYTISSIEVVK